MGECRRMAVASFKNEKGRSGLVLLWSFHHQLTKQRSLFISRFKNNCANKWGCEKIQQITGNSSLTPMVWARAIIFCDALTAWVHFHLKRWYDEMCLPRWHEGGMLVLTACSTLLWALVQFFLAIIKLIHWRKHSLCAQSWNGSSN